jgi:transposase
MVRWVARRDALGVTGILDAVAGAAESSKLWWGFSAVLLGAEGRAQHPSVSGHEGRYEMRELVNALLYQSRTGCQWDSLPHDLPPAGAVKYYFYTWRDDGTDQVIHDLLRWQVRERRGRLADPSLVVIGTQSLRAAAGVPAETTGRDAAKKVPGGKRGLAVDVLGLVIAVVVLAASVHDIAFGTALLDKVAASSAGTVTKALVDQGFKKTVVDHGRQMGIEVEIVERNPVGTGFVPQPIRWRVERTDGILMLLDPLRPPPPAAPIHVPARPVRLQQTTAEGRRPDRPRQPAAGR